MIGVLGLSHHHHGARGLLDLGRDQTLAPTSNVYRFNYYQSARLTWIVVYPCFKALTSIHDVACCPLGENSSLVALVDAGWGLRWLAIVNKARLGKSMRGSPLMRCNSSIVVSTHYHLNTFYIYSIFAS
jgi:hypothetical protein